MGYGRMDAQLVRALRHVDFNNTPSFSSESYAHSPYYDIPARFEMIPVADFEKKDFFDHLELTDKIKNFFFF